MNILVCIKQVPDTTEIRMDPKTNTLIRAGVPSTVNPFDKYALEAAVQLRETLGGTVTAMTMGPAQAAQALRECYALGADRDGAGVRPALRRRGHLCHKLHARTGRAGARRL